MRRAGNSDSDIIKNTGYAKSTLYRVAAAFESTQLPQLSKENQNKFCWAENDVEVKPKIANVKTGTKAQR